MARAIGTVALGLLLSGCGGPVVVPDVGGTPDQTANDSGKGGAKTTQPVRLAVLVVFDQMRGDYPRRWADLFGEGGFRRVRAEGATFTQAHLPYAWSSTAPGHASLGTGAVPRVHGIIENDWFDRGAGGPVSCVVSARHKPVPAVAGQDGEAGPDQLLAPTLGQTLKEATAGKGKVVSLALKDRAAVLMAGPKADACYWLDPNRGTFATSTAYRDAPHAWVRAFNAERPANRWFGKDWTRLRADLDYDAHSGPDDAPGEATGVAQGRAFPHSLTGGLTAPGPLSYRALANSPMANELLWNLAREAIDREELGKDDLPDLLCLSFSAGDTVGHCWGPDSHEVLDTTLRADRLLAEVMKYLDERVGKDRYALAITADHGICPLLETARRQGKPAGSIDAGDWVRGGDAAIRAAHGGAGGEDRRWVLYGSDYNLYLDRGTLRQAGVEVDTAADTLAKWVTTQRGVQSAYAVARLHREGPGDDPLARRVAAGCHPERSGDVVVVVKPYQLGGWSGTNHGTPHPYDTHVPLIIWGPGVTKGEREEEVSSLVATPVLARWLGIEPPGRCETPIPAGLFAE